MCGFITRGVVDNRPRVFDGLQMCSRCLPVLNGSFGQLKRFSLLGAFARFALATDPGEYDKSNAAE